MERENKPRLLNRLNRIEGQVRGVTRMIEEGRYCIDVLTQIKAARAATAEGDALITARGTIDGRRAIVGVQDFAFMGGSMGMAVGEAF
eukprot:gene13948-18468_t